MISTSPKTTVATGRQLSIKIESQHRIIGVAALDLCSTGTDSGGLRESEESMRAALNYFADPNPPATGNRNVGEKSEIEK